MAANLKLDAMGRATRFEAPSLRKTPRVYRLRSPYSYRRSSPKMMPTKRLFLALNGTCRAIVGRRTFSGPLRLVSPGLTGACAMK